MREKFIVIYATFPNLKTTKNIINALVKKNLAACGNIFKLTSIYIWKGKIEKTPEYGALIKTKSANYKKIEDFIKSNHPYEVPEIISWPIARGFKPYLDWIDKEI